MNKKFEVSGVYSMHIIGTIDAENEQEAINKFNDKLQENGNVDWFECQNITAEECLPNYAEKLNNVLEKLGCSCSVEEKPTLLFDCDDNNFLNYKLLEGKSKRNNSILMMVVNDEVFVALDHYKVYSLKGGEKIGANTIFQHIWVNAENRCYEADKNGDLNCVADSNGLTAYGKRVEHIKSYFKGYTLIVTHNSPYELDFVVAEDDSNHHYEANYDDGRDIEPQHLVKVQSII